MCNPRKTSFPRLSIGTAVLGRAAWALSYIKGSWLPNYVFVFAKILRDWCRMIRAPTPGAECKNPWAKQEQACRFRSRDHWVIWVLTKLVLLFIRVVQPPNPFCSIGHARIEIIALEVIAFEPTFIQPQVLA